MEVTDLTAFCLWFALNIPSYTLCQCQATKTRPSTSKPPSQPGQEPAQMVHGFSTIHGEAGAPPYRTLAWGTWPTGRAQPREGSALGALAAPAQTQGPGFWFTGTGKVTIPFQESICQMCPGQVTCWATITC